MSREIVYIDMDDTLVDFQSGIDAIMATREEERNRKGDWDDVEGIFLLMEPMPGAIEAAKELAELFDVYVLTKSPWRNQSAPSATTDWTATVRIRLSRPAARIALPAPMPPIPKAPIRRRSISGRVSR